ncbi:hypothetical protein ACVGWR_07925, partial [Enterobacter hormaechei]
KFYGRQGQLFIRESLGVLLVVLSYWVDDAGFRVVPTWWFDAQKSTVAGELSRSTFVALASPWARIAEEAEFPADYE